MTSTHSTDARAYTGPRLHRLIAVAGGVPVLSAVVAAGLMLVWAPTLPDPIAIHWGANGQVDGYGPLWSVIALVLGITTAFAGVVTLSLARMAAVAPPASGNQQRLLGAISVWMGVFLSIGIGGSVAMQRGLADAAAVGSVFAPMIAGAGIGLVLATLAWFVLPLPASVADGSVPATEAMALTADERVSWSATVRPSSLILWILGGALVVATVVSVMGAAAGDGWVLWLSPGVLLVVLVVSIVCFFWRVTVTAGGFSVRSAVGIVRVTIPLREIAAARVVTVSPMGDFGGWGWRVGGSRTGIVVRAGEALEVERRSGRSLVVTVDDAATAAALIGGLVERRGAV